mmetsp:Transcript_7188/g.20951  ORF Transcript_7188/g.20951 Transcript_7188/m.20951 type:complete len:108 (-) Transcript_7188:17-340(-)
MYSANVMGPPRNLMRPSTWRRTSACVPNSDDDVDVVDDAEDDVDENALSSPREAVRTSRGEAKAARPNDDKVLASAIVDLSEPSEFLSVSRSLKVMMNNNNNGMSEG